MELDRKARAYWTAGASAVWVVDAERKKAFRIGPTGEWIEASRIELAGASVDVAAILPGAAV